MIFSHVMADGTSLILFGRWTTLLLQINCKWILLAFFSSPALYRRTFLFKDCFLGSVLYWTSIHSNSHF